MRILISPTFVFLNAYIFLIFAFSINNFVGFMFMHFCKVLIPGVFSAGVLAAVPVKERHRSVDCRVLTFEDFLPVNLFLITLI